MDNLTTAVAATLASDREMSDAIQEIIKDHPQRMNEFAHQYAERIGNVICVSIGERLSLRFDGAVPKDGIHELLWLTFMGNVEWNQLGKYFLSE